MEGIVIRKYEEKDWKSLMEIHDEARLVELEFAGLRDAFVPLSEAAFSEGLFDYNIGVALVDNKVLGFVAYCDEELAWLYVDQKYKGQGVGKSLVSYVIDNTYIRPLCLEVLEGNDPAINLYKSMGFKTIEVLSGRMPGNESFKVRVNCMEKI